MRRNIAILLFILVILNLCMIPFGRGLYRPVKNWIYANHINDKITHFVFAAILTFLAYYILYPQRVRFWSVEIPLATLILLVILGLEETSQVFIRGRDADPFDLLASWSGLFLGNFLARWWDRRRVKKSS
jgi:VanZ family protein